MMQHEIRDLKLADFSRNKKVHVVHTEYTNTGARYRHDCHTLLYIAYGRGRLILDNAGEPISDGAAILIAPGTTYRSVAENYRIEVYKCMFDKSAVETTWKNINMDFAKFEDFFSGKTRYLRAADGDNRIMRDILVRMIDEILTSAPGGYDVILASLSILLVNFFRAASADASEQSKYTRNYNVDRVIRYIHEKVYSNVTLSEMAEHFNLSESMLCRLFNKHVGMTPMRYLAKIRIDKIKDTLRNTDKPIEKIAELFCYQPSYLRKLFKHYMGMSMLEYRKKYHYKSISPDDITS